MSKRQDCDLFHEKYQTLGETDQKTVSRIAGKLLGNNFLIKDKKDDTQDFFFVRENESCFQALFSMLDYNLVIQREIGVIYVKTLANRDRVHLSKFDTALLLILRKVYNQKKREVSTTDDVIVSVDDLISQMDTAQVVPDSRLVSKYNDALRKFRSHSIVNFSATRLNESTQIEILPSIQVVIPQEKLEEIIRRINELKREKEDEEGDNDEDTDENQAD